MRQREIHKNNVLIADFIAENSNLDLYHIKGTKKFRHEFPPLYHTSWDLLMPVVIKMASMKEYNKFRDGYQWPYLEGNPISCFSTSEAYDVNLDFNTLLQEVVDFIKWYNKIKIKKQ